ncbi:uncharacterized protein LOC133791425 [Humulus lupulus]|uniref:uncharacterized protein LOC133791425 n=1 Tax=Humulus lupulus TaxID=3486 RepID=UPI002B415069|nr:uncharacterized protein LOC133791425 [Humulus lupulus]
MAFSSLIRSSMTTITGVAAAAAYPVISLRSRSPQLHHISFRKTTSKKNYGLKSASLSVKFRISSLNFGSQPPRTVGLRVSCSAELFMALENEFNIDIPEEEQENISTVQAAIDYVTSHTA